MYDTYIVKRTQIYLDPAQAAALAARARRAGTTSSQLIREAVADYLSSSEADDQVRLARQRAAIEAVAGSMPDLPDAVTVLGAVRAGEAARRKALDDHQRR